MDSLSALLMGTGAANVNVNVNMGVSNGPSSSYSNSGGGSGGGSMAMHIEEVLGGGAYGRKDSLNSSGGGSGTGKAPGDVTYPDWKMELTMERLKQKVAQTRSFADLGKNVRTAILDRRTILDHNDKQHLQKSLDTLQQSINVNSLQSMVERLEMISRQQGLRFHPGGTGNEWFISSDMFFLELLIGSDGVVQEVKIQHDGKTGQQNCPEIITALQNNDFADFSAHLAGLVSIYALNADKNIKSKVFIALQALETDLSTIASTYSPEVKDGDMIVMKSQLGIVKPRTGGHPLKLTFYISPYEFLDTFTRSTFSNDVASILQHGLGTAATIAVQASQSHKLQMSGVVSVAKNDGKSAPRYGSLNATNSTALPACFTFNLQKPIVICTQILEKIHSITGIQSIDPSAVTMNSKPVLRLLTEHMLENGYKNGHTRRRERGLFVELPDQLHCYYMTEMINLDAVILSSIPFTLASQLPPIIALLRQQMTLNTLVGSCIRTGTPGPSDKASMVFEISPLSFQNITVTFQHPLEESLVTLEIDLRNVCHPLCKLHAMHPNAGVGVGLGMEIIPTLEEHACRVATRTMSIPVTLRAVIRRWQAIRAAYEPPPPVHEIQTGGGQRSSSAGPTDQQQQPTSCRTAAQATGAGSHRGSVPTMVTSMSVKQQQPPRVSSAPAAPLSTSTLTISPVTVSASGSITPPPPNAGMDLLSYMNMGMANPLLKTLSQFPNMPGLHTLVTNPAYQMLASQLATGASSSTGNFSQAALLELVDQVRNSTGAAAGGKKRKRKSSSTSGNDYPVPILPAPTPSQRGHSASLSGGPKRRMSESNEPGGERVPTPNTIAREMMMSEYGLDSPRHAQSRGWAGVQGHGIDITPVPVDMGSFMAASNLLSAFGAAAAANANIKQEPGEPGHDMVEFMQPKRGPGPGKRSRDHTPKRSMSLDSAHLQNLGVAAGPGRMVPPSLSITPVPAGGSSSLASLANSSGGPITDAARAILAGMKSGIDVKPFPGHGLNINIPSSITVTPIVSNAPTTPTSSSSGGEKKPTFTKKLSADEFDMMLGKKKKVVEAKQRKGSLTEELLKKAQSGSINLGMDKKAALASLGLGLSQKTGTPGLLTGLQKKSQLAKASGALTSPKISAKSSGKLGVTTLKSATGSSITAITTTGTGTTKPKPKEKKPGFTLTPSSSTGSPKPLSKSSSFPAPPTLKPIYDISNAPTVAAAARSEPTTPTTPTTPGGNMLGSNKAKGAGFVQTGSVRKGGLLAGVIDKLKSQASVESTSVDSAGAAGGKKELSRLDYLKASTTITNEMQNLQKGKGNAGGNGNGNGAPSPGTVAGQNPEYSVRPGGGQGLKLTIKAPIPGKGEKSGAKTPGSGSALKRPFSPSTMGGTGGSKGTPLGGKITAKKPKLESSATGRASPSSKEQQLDLTKKLFQPGAVRSLEAGGSDAPKFDTSFQIPKKKPATPPITSTTSSMPAESSPAKEVKTPSPPPKVSPPPVAPTAVETLAPDEMQVDAPEPVAQPPVDQTPASPDLSPAPMREDATTPTIPTTPVAAAAPPEPEIPILEHSNSTPTGDTPASPHEATPPVLELQHNFSEPPPASEPEPAPLVREEEPVAEEPPSASASVEMPPPLVPLTPIPSAPSPATSSATPSSPAPPPIALAVASPSSTTAVTSIVHIVHSPQPNSPLPAHVSLRSPLITVQSPHSVGGGSGGPAASPYTIDDDLMDEALTGGVGAGSGSGGGSGVGSVGEGGGQEA